MFVSNENYDSIESVAQEYPGATHIEPVDGGWIVFETATDYHNWPIQT